MSSDRELLEGFIAALFKESGWPDGGDIDMFAFQDIAVEYGILIPREVTEPCNIDCEETKYCHCADYGDFPQTCYRMADWLIAAASTAPADADDAQKEM